MADRLGRLMAADWRCITLDVDLARVAAVATFDSLEFTARINGAGGWIITGPSDDPGLAALAADPYSYLEIGTVVDGEWATLVEGPTLHAETSARGTVQVSGATLEKWAEWRYTWGEYGTPPGSWTGSTPSLTIGAADAAAMCYLTTRRTCGDFSGTYTPRRLPWLSMPADVSAVTHVGTTLETREAQRRRLDQVCTELADASGAVWMWRSTRATGDSATTREWQFFVPAASGAEWGPGDVTTWRRHVRRPVGTLAVVGGTGSGGSREFAHSVPGSYDELTEAPIVDAFEVSVTAQLQDQADAELARVLAGVTTYDVELAVGCGGLGRTWWVGDVGTVALPDGAVVSDVIGEVHVTVGPSGAQVTPSLGRTGAGTGLVADLRGLKARMTVPEAR